MQCLMSYPQKGRNIALPDHPTIRNPLSLSVLKETLYLSQAGHFPLYLQIVVLFILRGQVSRPLAVPGIVKVPSPVLLSFLYISPQISHLPCLKQVYTPWLQLLQFGMRQRNSQRFLFLFIASQIDWFST